MYSPIRMFTLRNSVLSYFVKNNLNVKVFSSTSACKEKKIKIGNWDINYLKVGNGPHHVLCMPGTLGSIWTDFKPQMESLNRNKFTIVAWDPPGYGRSRPPERDFPIDFYRRDAEYAYEFMKALKIPKYSLLGWSGGGVSSIILAAKYPEVVDKLVVWGVNVIIVPVLIEKMKSMKEIDSWSQGMRKLMIQMYGEELLLRYCAQWVEALDNLFNTRNGDICSEVLKDIRCPTLIMYGEKDQLTDIDQVIYIHTHIEGSRIHKYPEGKHNIHLISAEDFNIRVEDFLLSATVKPIET